MMTCLVVNYWNIKVLTANENKDPTTGKLGTGKADNAGLLLGMFVTIMFSARISGSHFNPCITLGFMLGNVKQMKFDRVLGGLYIAAQIGGAFLGNIFAKIFAAGLPAGTDGQV